jgi:hypothetical protein
MAVLATDNFNRADSTDLGTTWDVVPGTSNCQIVSNAVRASATNVDCDESYNGVTWPDDQYSQVTLAAVNSGGSAGPGVRASTTASTFYTVEATTNSIALWKAVNGSWTQIGSFSGTVSAGDIIRLEAQGTTLRVRQNGTQRISVTDSSISSGRAEIHIFLSSGTPLNAVILDDWEGGDFSGGGPLFGKLVNNPMIAGRLVL